MRSSLETLPAVCDFGRSLDEVEIPGSQLKEMTCPHETSQDLGRNVEEFPETRAGRMLESAWVFLIER